MNTKYFVNGREYYLTPEQIKQIESICTASEGFQLVAKKISELSNNEFYVKDYQRGYRWDETEIEALLEDIDNIDATEDGYCMQPLVVKKITEKQKHKPSQKLGESNKVEYTMPNGSYELLDGQQRLTTLWLIQAFLESKSDYSIYYELTRKTDEYYIENAKSTIEKWFKLQQKFNSCRTNTRCKGKEEQFVWNEANKNQYCEKMQKLFFIWYEVSNENVSAEKVFQSINEGKIELTNAELFKALLLNPDNVSNDTQINKLQQIAFEWDKLEGELHNDDFWYFISQEDVEKSAQQTRIDYIIEIYARELNRFEKLNLNPNKDRFSFLAIKKYLESEKSNKDILQIWEDIVKVYDKLYTWYTDYELYHTIGFLVAAEEKNRGSKAVASQEISALYMECKNKTNDEVKEVVKGYIYNLLISDKNLEIQNVQYEYADTSEITIHKKTLKNLLLFTNIYAMVFSNDFTEDQKKAKVPFVRFPYKLYHLSNWDIEHIAPRVLEIDLGSACKTFEDFKRNMISLAKEKGEDSEIAKKIYTYTDQKYSDDNYKDDKYKECCEIWKEYAKEVNQYPDNDFGNLVLLNSFINRSYGNAFFNRKRWSIINNDQNGVFVPICTRNVFMKYYTQSPTDFERWENSDKEDYEKFLHEMIKTIKGWKK